MKFHVSIFIALLILSAACTPQDESTQKTAEDSNIFLSFTDGDNEYQITKEIVVNGNDTTLKMVAPEFPKRKIEFDTPLVDTLVDPDDPSVILLIDTVLAHEDHYAKTLPLSKENISKETQRLKEVFKAQEVTVKAVNHLYMTKNSYEFSKNVMPNTDFNNLQAAQVNFELEKEDFTFDYTVLFLPKP